MGLWGAAEGRSGINDAYNDFVIERVSRAAVTALRRLRPAVLTIAEAHPSELDTFIHDDRPPQIHDAGVMVLRAATVSGDTIGTLVNWANHAETLGSKNTLITADYPHYLYEELEQRLDGVAVFFNGAVGGMQSPLGAEVPDPVSLRPAPENSFLKAELIGRRVANIAFAAIKNADPVSADRIEFREKRIEIPITNRGFQLAANNNLYKGRKKMTAGGGDHNPRRDGPHLRRRKPAA